MRYLDNILSHTDNVKNLIRLISDKKPAKRFIAWLHSTGAEMYPMDNYREMKDTYDAFTPLMRTYLIFNGVRDKDKRIWLLPKQARKLRGEKLKWYRCYRDVYEFLHRLIDDSVITYDDLYDIDIIRDKILSNPDFIGFSDDLLDEMIDIVLKDVKAECYSQEELYDV